MGKHVYGFSNRTDREEAKKTALDNALADGFITNASETEVTIEETDEHKANREFCVVIRTPEESA